MFWFCFADIFLKYSEKNIQGGDNVDLGFLEQNTLLSKGLGKAVMKYSSVVHSGSGSATHCL